MPAQLAMTFAHESQARSRHDDPETSHEAARRHEASGVAAERRVAIRKALQDAGKPLTPAAIALVADLDYTETQRRLSEVRALGWAEVVGKVPATSLGELLERVRCGRIEPVELPLPTNPPGSFHGDYVGFNCGVLYWHPRSLVDTFAHEAAHAMLLDDPVSWEAPEYADMKTDESVVMVLQCELVRGLEGAGVARMLAGMDEIGYQFYEWPGRPIMARTWWQKEANSHRPKTLPWEAA